MPIPIKRLTDSKTAADLRSNMEKLIAAGIEPNVSDLRYIRLADYEEMENTGAYRMKEETIEKAMKLTGKPEAHPDTKQVANVLTIKEDMVRRGYVSPIEQTCREIMRREEENLGLTIEKEIGYKVDKDELIKALRYDRDQYNKGFADGYAACKEKILKAMEE